MMRYMLIIMCATFLGWRITYAAPMVAIDVGHSKSFPGAISARGLQEFDFNVGLAKVVLQDLTAEGIHSFLIGADGDMKDLLKRSELAQIGGASFFLSIHHDSVQPQYLQKWAWQDISRRYSDKFSGFSLFVSRENPYLKASLSCAAAIGAALKEQGFHPSPHHAENIPGENKEWADKENGVYYYDNLSVLRNTKSPAVLLEAGVIVNRNEEEVIQQLEKRKAIATAVRRGISACGLIK